MMKNIQVKKCFRSTLLAALATTAANASGACGSSTPNSNKCGPGTSLQDGTCFAVDSGTADSGTSPADDSGSGHGSGEMDSTVDAARADGPDVADTGLGGDENNPPSSCPSSQGQTVVDCDPRCCALDTNCSEAGMPAACSATCGSSPQQLPQGNVVVVRLPANPGTNTACADTCASDASAGFVYALQIQVQAFRSDLMTVTVSPPWEIVQVPLCAIGGQCVHGTDPSGFTVAIATRDPSAPAANAVFQSASSCPASGDQ
jgi:hypothetical protein